MIRFIRQPKILFLLLLIALMHLIGVGSAYFVSTELRQGNILGVFFLTSVGASTVGIVGLFAVSMAATHDALGGFDTSRKEEPDAESGEDEAE